VCGISVQFRQPGGPSFLDKLRSAGKNQFYWFDMMRAESDQAWANAAVPVPGMMYWTSGEAPEASRWNPFDPSRGLLRPAPMVPRSIDATYIDEAVAAFTRTRFHGPLNYYRAVDLFTRSSAAFAGATIRQPSIISSCSFSLVVIRPKRSLGSGRMSRGAERLDLPFRIRPALEIQ